MKANWTLTRKSDNVSINQSENHLFVSMKTDKWAFACLRSDVFDCNENKIYKFRIDADGGESDFRLLIQFYKKDCLTDYREKEWFPEERYGYRLYINNGEEVCVPEGMECFDIAAAICTDKDEAVSLGDIEFDYVSEYKPKNVCMCAIRDDTIPREAWDSQMSVTDAYCRKIDEIVEKEHPDVITLTEHFHNMNVRNMSLEDKFITCDSPIIKMISVKAKQHGIYICGSFHILEDGCRYNRALMFDRNGEIIAKYDKNHLTIMEYEMGIKPGNDITYVDTDIGRIGFIICWDMYFPEIMRRYQRKSCDIILCPTRGDARYQNNASAFIAASYVVSSSFGKMNRIYDKNGDVISETNTDGYAVATADINNPTWRARLSVGLYYGYSQNVFMNEMRPETYSELADKVR